MRASTTEITLATLYDNVYEVIRDKLYIVTYKDNKETYGLDEYSNFHVENILNCSLINNEVIVIHTGEDYRIINTVIMHLQTGKVLTLDGKFLYRHTYRSFYVYLGKRGESKYSILLLVNPETGEIVCEQRCSSVSTFNGRLCFDAIGCESGNELKCILDSGDVVSFDEYFGMQTN